MVLANRQYNLTTLYTDSEGRKTQKGQTDICVRSVTNLVMQRSSKETNRSSGSQDTSHFSFNPKFRNPKHEQI